jgi:hypothetical protein
MKKLYYISKDIYGFMSFEDYRDLRYGVTNTAILQCGIGSYTVSIEDIKEETLSDQ